MFDHPRNKSDAMLRAMAEGGGVIGIFQINPYLGPNERNTLETYIAHIDHAINVAGIEHVGIGSDREHRTIPDTAEEKQKLIDELSRLRPVTARDIPLAVFLSELNHPRRMETIRRALEARRRPAAEIDRIMGGNFYRLFRDTIGLATGVANNTSASPRELAGSTSCLGFGGACRPRCRRTDHRQWEPRSRFSTGQCGRPGNTRFP